MKSILVCLDLTEMDDLLISYASLICESYASDQVYFLHVSKNLELPDEIVKNYGDVFASLDESIKHGIQQRISDRFKAKANVNVSVEEGNVVEKTLRYAKVKNVDLMIMGRKKQLKGSGVIPDSIVRKSPCHMLLLPESVNTQRINKILVPVDFSEHSHLAIEQAIALSERHQAAISCVNIYEVPAGYSKTGKSYEEFADIMLGHARSNYKKFVSKYGRDIPCDFILSRDHDFSDELVVYSQAAKPDIILLGSKGQSDAAVVLLGSMAEKLIKGNAGVPVLIVKRKGETLGILDALLRL